MNSIETQNINELAKVLIEKLKYLNQTISTAESCTGGLISSILTSIPGASSVFYGGCVAYDNSIKKNWLHVSSEVLEQHGAVSKETAEAMAQGGRLGFKTTFCISATGVAGPGGGSLEKPVGTVWLGFSSNINKNSKLLQLTGDRENIRNQTVKEALLFTLENLT